MSNHIKEMSFKNPKESGKKKKKTAAGMPSNKTVKPSHEFLFNKNLKPLCYTLHIFWFLTLFDNNV